ncbi:DUF6460 domain-containing protein [Azospirillum sp.]|uniref:DUF6460 domain-containing protein n=1 Tax=Azospirillum sp. TaxID=34012 RepID=UPI002D6E71B7|nr:DUF6460 domain-containing protein [Azospirillum sp.]HYD65224.1 DUF6460 domain-containing protein [Azospirillum sp.]
MDWIVKVVIASFLVGFALSAFDINPARILTDTWSTLGDVVEFFMGIVRWALPYILTGAIIVVPVAALGALARWTRSRRPRP